MQKCGIRSGVTPAASDTGRIRPLERSSAGHEALCRRAGAVQGGTSEARFRGLTV